MDEMIRKANPFNANRLIIKLFNKCSINYEKELEIH